MKTLQKRKNSDQYEYRHNHVQKKINKQDLTISKKDNTSGPSRVYPRMQDWLNTQKINVIHQTNRTKGKNHHKIFH